MPPSSDPTFGKRNAPPVAAPRKLASVSASTPLDQVAFFAAVRDELDTSSTARTRIVPRSFTAALLAGLVVGCALAGFNVTGGDGASEVAAVGGAWGLRIDTAPLLPGLILLGLVGGARAAAMTILVVHALLDRAGRIDHAAYAAGGAAASACLAGALLAIGHSPPHGWAIELCAGAATGLLYRIFAGSRQR